MGLHRFAGGKDHIVIEIVGDALVAGRFTKGAKGTGQLVASRAFGHVAKGGWRRKGGLSAGEGIIVGKRTTAGHAHHRQAIERHLHQNLGVVGVKGLRLAVIFLLGLTQRPADGRFGVTQDLAAVVAHERFAVDDAAAAPTKARVAHIVRQLL